MNELDAILQKATNAIEEEFFLLPIFGGKSVYRERVYCYELYHQMRSLWPEKGQCRYCLNGEVDKRAHVAMEQLGIRAEKPDLLVHCPGDMADNHAVIEVKPAKASARGIRKDLTTIARFRHRARYQRGLYLIYGLGAGDHILNRVRRAAAAIEGSEGTEIWLHSTVGEPAICAAVL